MSAVQGLLSKANNLLGKAVTRRTKVYDASKNYISVAGIAIDGVVTAEISADVVSRTELGVDKQYYCYFEAFDNPTLTVTVLPTAQCNDVLKALAVGQRKSKGWVRVTVTDNGRLVGNFRGHLISGAGLQQGLEAGDRTYTFGLFEVGTQLVNLVETQIGTTNDGTPIVTVQ